MDLKQKSWLMIALALLLIAASWWAFWPPGKQIRKGLDLQGGLSVILTARQSENAGLTPSDMDRAEAIIEERVNGLGVSEASVQRQGATSILVQLPGVKDPQAALEALGQTGQLAFVDVQSIQSSSTIADIVEWSSLTKEQRDRVEAPQVKEGTYQPVMTGEVITRASAQVDETSLDPNDYVVNVAFNQKGTKAWADYTTSHVNKQVAILLDGKVISAPVVREAITGGDTEISSFDAAEAKRISTILESGALPVALDFSQAQVVGPTLGRESLDAGLLAGLIGLAAVAIYMIVYYRALGLLTVASLAAFGSMFLGVLAIMSRMGAFSLTLPGIAGLVLSIGVAADTSILMFERFKEELDMGRTARTAAKSSTWHALGVSVDADIVTFVTAIAIFLLAIGPVRGFALTLLIGIVIDLVVAFLLTRNAIILLADSVVTKVPWLWGMKGGGRDA